MSAGIQKIHVFGCLLLVLVAGCKSAPAPAPPAAATNDILVSAGGAVVSDPIPETGKPFAATNAPGSSPIQEYEVPLHEAIVDKWGEMMDQRGLKFGYPDEVKAKFNVHSDGTISDLVLTESSTNNVLNSICLKAVSAASPFQPWSENLRKLVGRDFKEETMTFGIGVPPQ